MFSFCIMYWYALVDVQTNLCVRMISAPACFPCRMSHGPKDTAVNDACQLRPIAVRLHLCLALVDTAQIIVFRLRFVTLSFLQQDLLMFPFRRGYEASILAANTRDNLISGYYDMWRLWCITLRLPCIQQRRCMTRPCLRYHAVSRCCA